ncbi:hypothetical protein [Furfurilactobacillus siliginis]|uniref:Uncharacterized protein n=1 Tax=Furfurilactobacillus siliginis TaxID=348151 RepID=A0A0R2L5K3_9LACO|nr:hypothetical protein [Furfurilactobacillus siliginis]KRN96931.1 hypothetical protein IV55_GL000805 [Furfurilactobacillus siliginis]GEK27690.1 hypothetical protein LSI01_00010 [Furfurilactobacillus siliginis]
MENNTEPRITFMHPQLRIVKADALNRPTNARLLQAAGASAVDSRGADLTPHLNANLENIDFAVPGQHQVPVAVMDDRGNVGRSFFTLVIVNTEADLDGRSPIIVESAPASAAASQAATTAPTPAPQPRRHRHLWIGALVGLLALVLIIWGVSAHNNAQNQAAMASSSSSAESSSIAASQSAAESSKAAASSAAASSQQASLASQNSGLSSQLSSLKAQSKATATVVKDLQKTVTDYKENSDRAQYEASIANLQQQVSNLQAQISQGNGNAVSRGILTSQVNKLSDTIGDLENSASPSDASSTLKNSGVNGIVSKIQSLLGSL